MRCGCKVWERFSQAGEKKTERVLSAALDVVTRLYRTNLKCSPSWPVTCYEKYLGAKGRSREELELNRQHTQLSKESRTLGPGKADAKKCHPKTLSDNFTRVER